MDFMVHAYQIHVLILKKNKIVFNSTIMHSRISVEMLVMCLWLRVVIIVWKKSIGKIIKLEKATRGYQKVRALMS